MFDRTALVAVLALPFISDLHFAPNGAPRAAEIRFAPAEGLALRKSFESQSTQQLDSMSVVMDGQEQEQDQTQETTTVTRLVVMDSYLELDEGRVTKLERSFEEFDVESDTEITMRGEDHEVQGQASCELTDHTVLFTWDADEEEYVASSEDDGVAEDWLEELDFELEFLAFLPDGEVADGDEWEVDAEELRRFLRFDRNLPLEWTRSFDGEEREQPEDEDDEAEPDESLSGELAVRFDGLREVDGVDVAVLHLSGEYEASTEAERSMDGEHGTQTTISENTISVEIEGELLWNTAAGHFHSCTLEAETASTTTAEITMEFGDQTMEFEQESSTSGSMTYTATFEVAE